MQKKKEKKTEIILTFGRNTTFNKCKIAEIHVHIFLSNSHSNMPQ